MRLSSQQTSPQKTSSMSKQTTSPDPAALEARDLRLYRLKITIDDTDPPIWRRLEVHAGMEMDSLATAIETVFGWSGEHMGEFNVKGRTIGDDDGWSGAEPDLGPLEDIFGRIQKIKTRAGSKTEKQRRAAELFAAHDLTQERTDANEPGAAHEARDVPTLGDLVPRVRTKFTYTYDFGDDWKHLIEVEKIAPAEPGARYPRCTDGARANPIEDCGGPWGFAELVEAAGNSKHERFADLEEWGLAKWDPAKFPVEQANRELARVFRIKK